MTTNLTIPLDPTGLSLNRWHGYHWSKKREIKSEWSEAVQWIAQSKHNGLPLKNPRVTLTCYFRTKHKRDKDNFSIVAKVVLDGLTKAGIIEDDNSEAIDLRPLEFDYDKRKPRVEITIEAESIQTDNVENLYQIIE